MKPLTKQDFADGSRRVFQPHEMNEIILIIYRVLTSAIIGKQCDSIILTSTHLTALKGKYIVSELDIGEILTTVTLRQAFDIIYERDALIREHISILSSSQDRILLGIAREPID
jgi:hypothetical protein